MTAAKFTPGPWSIPHFVEAGNCQCGYVFSDSQQGMGSVCAVTWGGEDETKEVASANARLIAAAPALLAALQAILPFIPKTTAADGGASSYSEMVRAADAVRAAIAAATGEAA